MMTEAEASKDLDVCGYAGKWNRAKEVCGRHHVAGTHDYWANVRKHFLEIGGTFLDGHKE